MSYGDQHIASKSSTGSTLRQHIRRPLRQRFQLGEQELKKHLVPLVYPPMNRQIPQWIGLNSRRINDFDWEIRRTRPQSTPIKPLERNEQTSTQTCPVLGWKSALDLYRVVSLRLDAVVQYWHLYDSSVQDWPLNCSCPPDWCGLRIGRSMCADEQSLCPEVRHGSTAVHTD